MIAQITKTYDELIDLLYSLDKAIEREWPENELSIRLEVVGGFALLYHGLRINDPLTRDIDLINELSSRIWKIAYNIDSSNWLSDDASSLLIRLHSCVRENLEFVKDTKYRFPNDHIELWIASLDTLMKMKVNS